MFQCVGVWISTGLILIKIFKGEVYPVAEHEGLEGSRGIALFFL
jgi:hypothetical protein